ncbi:MAG: glycosyltransferase family 2 protein [Butyrivibrio sp.]|nr:glycosyltransferase family 2 protein [Butyrivibrio sp.]
MLGPKVSAIIITHNRCEMLKRAVNSVINQTYKNIELIVVDDASDDGTQEYGNEINRIGYKYIRIEKEESRGGNHARNIGIANSSGTYIAFLDDDDYWMPIKTEKQVSVLDDNPEIGLVFSGLYFEFKNKYLNYPKLPNRDAYGDIVEKELYVGPFCTTITMMIRKSLLDAIGGFDENVKYWQEYELSLRLIQITQVGLIYDCLSVANRDLSVKRLTNQLDSWKENVEYINNKHRELFSKLSEEGKRKKKEIYYREAAYRASVASNKVEMKRYYMLANNIHGRIEYVIRGKLGLSKNDTLLLESIIMKCKALFLHNKIGEIWPNAYKNINQ